MKKLTLTLLAAASLLTPFTTMAAEPAPYRHVVIFGFKEGTPPAKIEEIATAFKALSKSIPNVKTFEWGLNVSPEKMNPDLTHVFTVGFENKAALESGYLHHPDHEKFVTLLKPHIAKAVVVDYVAQ
jgi:Stress responsive A/B Barrel Domain